MDLSLQKQFENLRDISDEVADYLARELFKVTYDEIHDYKINDVLQDCYAIVIQELKELGIKITLHEEDLLQDWYTAINIYYIRKIASVNYINKLLQDKDISHQINLLLTSDENIDTLFSSLVEYLLTKYQDNEELTHLSEILQYIQSTERFKAHVQAIIKHHASVDQVSKIQDINLSLEYIKKTQTLRVLVRKVVDVIIEKLNLIGNYDKVKMDKLIDDYDIDKIDVDNINIYSIVDKEITKDDRLYPIHKKYMDIHHINSSHHIEHWLNKFEAIEKVRELNQDISPIYLDWTKENFIILTAHHLEPGVSLPEFKSKVEDMVNNNLKLFDPKDVAFINQCVEAVVSSEQLFTTQAVDLED